jgi:hypothetical protein
VPLEECRAHGAIEKPALQTDQTVGERARRVPARIGGTQVISVGIFATGENGEGWNAVVRDAMVKD